MDDYQREHQRYSPGVNLESLDAFAATILTELKHQNAMYLSDKIEAQHFRETILDQIARVNKKVDTVEQTIARIDVQTTKTNGRVTATELLTAEIKGSVKDDCIRWSSIFDVKKHWKIWLAISVVTVASGFLTKILAFMVDVVEKYVRMVP